MARLRRILFLSLSFLFAWTSFSYSASEIRNVPTHTNAITYDQKLLSRQANGGYLWPGVTYSQAQINGAQSKTLKDVWIAHNLSFTLRVLPKEDNSYILPLLNRTILNYSTGNHDKSFRYLLNAKQVMDSLKQKGFSLGKESTKIFKSEPYEQSMASLYMGLLLYAKGDFQNSRAMFAQALELDRECVPVQDRLDKFAKKLARNTKSLDEGEAKILLESFGNDNRLAHYMLARSFMKLGEEQNIRISLENSKQWNPVPDFVKKGSSGRYISRINAYDTRPPSLNPFLTREALDKHNLILLIQMGFAPSKAIGGHQGNKDFIAPREYPERKAVVYVDGKMLCKAYPMLNLLHQAIQMTRTGKDTAQTGKAIGKSVVWFLAAMIDDNLANTVDQKWSVAADTRRWGSLPNEIHIASATVEPGLHTITVLFYDKSGNPLPHYEQTHYYVPLKKKEETFLVVRSLRDKFNTVRSFYGSKVTSYNKDKREIVFYPKDLSGLREGLTLNLVTIEFGDKILEDAFHKARNTNIGQHAHKGFSGFEVKKVGAVKITELEKKKTICELTEGNPNPKQILFVTTCELPGGSFKEFSNHPELNMN